MIKRIFKHLELVAFLTLTFMFIGYAYFWDLPTIEVYEQPFPVASTQLRHGDSIIYSVKFCRKTNQPAHISRTLQPVDEPERTILLSSQISNLPTSAEDCGPDNPDFVKIGSGEIPDHVPYGCYNLRIDATYNFPLKAPQVNTFYTEVICITALERANTTFILAIK